MHKGITMTQPVNKDINVGNNMRVNVFLNGDDFSVGYYDANYRNGPDKDLAGALQEALESLLNDEVASRGAEYVYGKKGVQYVGLPQLPGVKNPRLVVTQGLQFTVGVEHFVHSSCPGQPGFYPVPAWLHTTALAVGLVETLKRQLAGKAPEVLKTYEELNFDPAPVAGPVGAPAAE